MKTRCSWVGQDPLYIKYHDTEWGGYRYMMTAYGSSF